MLIEPEKLTYCSKIQYNRKYVERRERNCAHPLASLFIHLYKFKYFRRYTMKCITRLEGGYFFSKSLRYILNRYHRIEVGMYSYGACLQPGIFPEGTIVGNYTSIAVPLFIFRRNHPVDFISTHPFFYNRFCKIIDNDRIDQICDNPLEIGHDVWIGANTTILPNCKKIGNGSVVGANSVLTKNVEPFTIVAGNPAKKLKDRFPEHIKEAIVKSEWWDKSIVEISKYIDLFTNSINNDISMKILTDVLL